MNRDRFPKACTLKMRSIVQEMCEKERDRRRELERGAWEISAKKWRKSEHDAKIYDNGVINEDIMSKKSASSGRKGQKKKGKWFDRITTKETKELRSDR